MAAKKTTKQQKNINLALYALVALVVIIMIWKFIIKPMQVPQIDGSTADSSGTRLPTSSSLPKVGNDTILKRGSKAQEVAWVQYYYNKKLAIPAGKTKLVVDGIFGAKTEAAVMAAVQQKTTSWTAFKARLDGGPIPTPNSSTTNNVLSGSYDWSFGNSGMYDEFQWVP